MWLPAGCAIVKGAPNLENAKKFIDFIISYEGQIGLADTTVRPTLASVVNTSPFMKPFSEINVAYEDIPFCAENQEAWRERWTQILTEG